MLATFSAITGSPLDQDGGYDSYDLFPALTGSPGSMIRDHLVISPNSPDHLLVRRGKWVYIPARDEGGFQGRNPGEHSLGGAAALSFTGQTNSDIADGKVKPDAPPAQLYDLSEDPFQAINVYGQHPDVVEELQGILNTYRKNTGPYQELGWIDRRQ